MVPQLIKRSGKPYIDQAIGREVRMDLLKVMLIGLIGFGLTLGSWWIAERQTELLAQGRFDRLLERTRYAIVEHMERHRVTLDFLAGLFHAQPELRREQFSAYLAQVDLNRSYGALGYGFIRYVPRADLAAFLARTRTENVPNFQVKRDGGRPDLFVIEYIEPQAANLPALGLDIAHEPLRRAAAIASVELGQIMLTRRITLVQDQLKLPSLLLLRPVYVPGLPLANAQQRWSALMGWTYTPLRIDKLMHGLDDIALDQIDVEIFELEGRGKTLLFDLDHMEPHSGQEHRSGEEHSKQPYNERSFQRSQMVEVYGQRWELEFSTTPQFDRQSNRGQPRVILFAGITISLLAMVLGWNILSMRRRAAALAHKMTIELQASEQAAQALLAELSQQKQVIDQHALVSVTNLQGEILYANEHFCNSCGYQLSELLGQNPRVLNSGVHPPELFQALKKSLQQGQFWHGELCNRCKDGSLRWFDCTIAPMLDKLQQPERYIAIYTDITARKTYEQDLLENSARLAMAASAGHMGLWSHDFESGRSETTVEWRNLLGAPLEQPFDALGWVMEHAHPDDRARLRRMSEECQAGQLDSMQIEFRFHHPQRGLIWLYAAGLPRQHGPDGRLKTMVGLHQDITAQKEAERLKSEFVSTVSHELRTPLTAIAGSLSLVYHGVAGQLPDAAARMIELAWRNAQRLGLLINDLLDMEKISAGRLEMTLERQAILPLVKQAVDANQPYADQFGVRLVLTELADGLVNIDGQRLLQILANFLSNAAKFSPREQEVWIALRLLDDSIQISVQDRAGGIPAHFARRIFERFAQADGSDRRQKGGTGLGLAISKELAQLMGGEVGFTTEEGVGSTFWVRFPLAKTSAENVN